MTLLIDDSELEAQVQMLASLTGRSASDAVRMAVADKLAQYADSSNLLTAEERLQRIDELSRVIAKAFGGREHSSDHADL